MNIYQPYEIGLNYINISGAGPFTLGPDLVAANLSNAAARRAITAAALPRAVWRIWRDLLS